MNVSANRSTATRNLTRLRWLVNARRHPSAFLLFAQLAALVYPFVEETRAGTALLGALGVLVLGLAIWMVRRTPNCCF